MTSVPAWRAAVVAGPGRTEVRSQPAREPAAGEVVVAVEGCGICGSNLPVWQGRDWFPYPLPPGAPGHEGWGVVDSCGAGVSTLRPGDRVAFLGEDAFASHVVVPAGAAVVLPKALDGQPFAGEAIGCGVNVTARAGFEPGQAVTVVGVGFLGAIVVGLAAKAGAEVVAVSRRPYALEVARAMGAKEVVQSADHGAVVAAVRELTGGRMCDVVVEAVGTQEPLDLASELVAVRGRLVLAGYHQDGRRSVDVQSWGWRGIDVVNAHERDPLVQLDGIRRGVELVTSGALETAPLHTHRFALDELGAALDALEQRPDGFLKGWVAP